MTHDGASPAAPRRPGSARLAGLLSHFRIDVEEEGSARVLKLHGELDLASSVVLEEELEKPPAADLMIVDLSNLDFIDSSGIGVLVKANQTAGDQGRRFALVRGGGQVGQLLELTGLADELTVVGSLAELRGT